ncbi:MAG: hypothetical protein HDP34_04245 [Clostridia bacterium]|nr:hypothetical protein [Clostridia bacterium]
MSLKKVDEVKKDRGFKLFDLIIYGIVVLIVAVLFIVIFTTKNTDPLTGISIYRNAELVFEYEFGGKPEYSDMVEVQEDDKGLTVTVNADGEINVIYIDKSAKTVKMQDANCKGKDCLYFSAIDDNNKIIYCNPHRLRIEPLISDYDSPIIIM